MHDRVTGVKVLRADADGDDRWSNLARHGVE